MRAKAVHTLESILARTVEEGDCRIWHGYVTSKTPQVDVDGKMMSVRRLIVRLQGRPENKGAFYGVKCGTYLCVCPEHIIQLTRKQHSTHMAKAANDGAANIIRKVKITAHKRASGKLDMDTAREIRVKEGTYRDIAKEYGISHSLVGHIKRGRYWKETSNPFAGLGA